MYRYFDIFEKPCKQQYTKLDSTIQSLNLLLWVLEADEYCSIHDEKVLNSMR